MTSRYAKATKVPVSRSRSEIERVLEAYGCDSFGYLKRGDDAVIQFEHLGRPIRLAVSAGESPQETRQRWRILLLWVKATLESIDVGLTDFETAFAMQTMLPDGRTVADKVMPDLQVIADEGGMPTFRLGPGS